MGARNQIGRYVRPRKDWIIGAVLLLAGLVGLVWAAEAAQDRNFLWKVSEKGRTVYVLGSIHFAKPDLYPLNSRIEEAFQSSGLLAVEVDLDAVDKTEIQRMIQATGFFPEGRSLEEVISPETRSKLKELGVDVTQINRLRPWLVAFTLSKQKLESLGFDGRYGVDQYFLDKARRENKSIAELETFADQLNLFSGFSDSQQDLFLRATLMELENMDGMISRVVSAWRSGDTAEFGRLFFSEYENNPELQPVAEKLFYSRNGRMTSKVEGFLKEGRTCFVIVGAGHLVGNRGVIQQLKDKGYNVEQL